MNADPPLTKAEKLFKWFIFTAILIYILAFMYTVGGMVYSFVCSVGMPR